MELQSSLTLLSDNQPLLLEKRIKLLEAIEQHGSISKAAKAVPMSYKAAWEAIDSINNLSSKPVVERETGGKGGGGTVVTPYGKKLIEMFYLLKKQHQLFIDKLCENADFDSGDLGNLKRIAMQISARNQLQGRVLSLHTGEVSGRVVLELKSKERITANITKDAVENLGLREGMDAVAIFKSSSVLVAKEENLRLSAQNSLSGPIIQITTGEVNVEVIARIGQDETIAAVITKGACDELDLQVGNRVTMLVKSSSVMVGV